MRSARGARGARRGEPRWNVVCLLRPGCHSRTPDPDRSQRLRFRMASSAAPIGSKNDRSIWSPVSLRVLIAYENGVENVVAFLTDGISAQSLGAHGRNEARERRALLTQFQCEPIPRAAVRLVSPAMGPAKSGQGPMIRKVLKSTCRLAQRGGFLYVSLPVLLSQRPRRHRHRLSAHD